MTIAVGAATLGVLLTTSLLGLAEEGRASGDNPAVTVELRVIVHGSMDADSLDLARESALGLLATAGIAARWRDCGNGGTGCGGNEGPAPIVVLLLPVLKMSQRAVCGEASRDGRTGVRTVLVYVPRHLELARDFRSSAGTRSHPGLVTLQAGHLVGLTMAHEVGHVLGLAHAGAGVMKARPNVGEIVALRTSQLRFDATEVTRMRLALRGPADVLAGRR
jgi:hypothetical protein